MYQLVNRCPHIEQHLWPNQSGAQLTPLRKVLRIVVIKRNTRLLTIVEGRRRRCITEGSKALNHRAHIRTQTERLLHNNQTAAHVARGQRMPTLQVMPISGD